MGLVGYEGKNDKDTVSFSIGESESRGVQSYQERIKSACQPARQPASAWGCQWLTSHLEWTMKDGAETD